MSCVHQSVSPSISALPRAEILLIFHGNMNSWHTEEICLHSQHWCLHIRVAKLYKLPGKTREFIENWSNFYISIVHVHYCSCTNGIVSSKDKYFLLQNMLFGILRTPEACQWIYCTYITFRFIAESRDWLDTSTSPYVLMPRYRTSFPLLRYGV